jgi:hypothetical protein
MAATAGAGTGVNPINISAKSVSKTTTNGTAATSSFTFRTDRTVKNQDGATLQTWLDAGYSPADYQIRATLVSGNAPTGSSLGTWLSLSTNRTWSLTDPAGSSGSKTCKVKLEIRDAGGDNTIRDTATYTMSADSQASGGTGGVTFTPAPGDYSVDDNVDIGEAYFQITASGSVVWNWSPTTIGLNASLASGSSGTSIDFDLNGALHADRSVTVTVTVGTNTWKITMTASALDQTTGTA